MNFENSCSVAITTWRQDTSGGFSNLYTRVSTTKFNVRYITPVTSSFALDESLHNYELTNPIQVQPGDFVGIETEFSCTPPDNFDNILSLNVSESNTNMLSYRRSFGGTQFFLLNSTSTMAVNGIIPILMPVFGQLMKLYVFLLNLDIQSLNH